MKLFKAFLKDAQVASVTPSSPALVNQLLAHVDFTQAKTIVEYGMGDGVITREILKRMRRDAKLIAFETNKELIEKSGLCDARLVIHHIGCEKVSEYISSPVDYVISGVPFSLFPQELTENILQQTATLLPLGTFLVYQVRNTIHSHLKAHFSSVKIERCVLNVPPLKIFTARV